MNGWVALASLALAATPAKKEPAKEPVGSLDTARLEKLTQAKGAAEPDGAYQVSVPRSDLDVYAGGIHVTPRLGLTAWATFQKTPKGAQVHGEMVLVEDQVPRAIRAALDAHLDISQLHTHFMGESPRVLFLDVSGQGDEVELATGIGKLFEVVKQKTAEKPHLAELDAPVIIDPKKVEASLGAGAGKLDDGVYLAPFLRSGKSAHWAAFAGSDAHAALSGQFTAHPSEVRALLDAVTAAGLQVTSVDSPWPDDSPRLVSVHVWAIGPVEKLAAGFKAGLGALKEP
jgi:hypothetical protein